MSDMFERLSNLSPKRLALLAMELQERLDEAEQATSSRAEPVAVIGMGCRLPGASNPDAYWDMLLDGVDAITEIPPSRWDVDAYYDPDPDTPGKIATRWAGTLDDVDLFEPQMFGISPREAQTMDPQQRLLLEVAWETLEHAGISPDAVHGTETGSYIGVCNADYAQLLMDGDESELDMYLSTGNAGSVASGRLSYVLGLQGPAMTIDTACSSSLVAVHLAVQAVRSGECRMALAGGVNVILSPKSTMTLSRAKMMASDGRCKSFDASGDGFVRGEGCGLVALKKLSDARADGDRVLAVIRGSAVNQDGRSNGLTAPNGPSQVAVLRAALADAGISADEVGYVETHGTGTPLGDPIEAQSLGTAMGAGRDASNRLSIGSAKSNLGHLESAAGVAGLIKLILTIQHGEFPPLLHFSDPNPYIPWEHLPIDVPTTRTPWPSGRSRIGGVSSFGFSGTNAHVLVEAAPDDEHTDSTAPDSGRDQHIVTLSARTETALADLAASTGAALEVGNTSLADAERTLNLGRSVQPHRLAVVGPDATTMAASLSAWAEGTDVDSIVSGIAVGTRSPSVGFLFTGHGSQHPGMGRDLYDTSVTFRDAIDRCAALLEPLMDRPLTTVMYDDAESVTLLGDMAYAQPAVFAIEYALAEVWKSWGLVPSIVAGHSVGEYVAAVVAGAMRLEDGIRLVAARGRLMSTLPPDGEMATVFASEERVRAALTNTDGAVSIAAVNGPLSIALSGTGGRLTGVLDELRAEGVEVRSLAIPIAAHSPQIDPILDEFESVAATVEFTTPRIDIVSGMTGEIASGDDVVTASYWRRHLRQPVRFADAFRTMHGEGVRTFVEIGPHPTLLNMGRHIVDEHECRWLPSLRNGRGEYEQLLGSVGALFTAGVDFDWKRIGAPGGTVATLPTYPFERDRYWAVSGRTRRSRTTGGHPLLGDRIASPALRDAVFENELSATWPAFLDHHRVFGTALVPSPAFLEMALAAGARLDGAEVGHAVERFEIREGLVLPEDSERRVQFVLREAPDGGTPASREFEVFSRADDADDWSLHATGALTRSPSGAAAPEASLDVADVRARCGEHIEGGDYYAKLAELGLEFGRSFRGVTDVWRRDGEALGRIELPAELIGERAQFGIHPAMLDACFHVLGASMAQVEEQTYLLIGIDEFRLHAPPGAALWNHTVLRAGFDDIGSGAAEMISGDIRLFDDDGHLVAEALGLHLRAAHRDALMRSTRRVADDWAYTVDWQPAPCAEPDPDSDDADREWVIVGDGDGLGAAVSKHLDGEARSAVHIADADALAGHLTPASGAPVRVLHIGTIGAQGDPNDDTARTNAVLDTFQTLLASGTDGELWVATRGGQPADDGPIDVDQTAVWGLGRVIAVEHPELWGGLVDLAPDHDLAGDAQRLVDTIRSAGVEDQVALRDDRRLVPRLARTTLPTVASFDWRSEATYLVTGGLGGLGLQMLPWMAEHGAGTIVVTGRTPLPERDTWDDVDPASQAANQIEAIRTAEANGATVVPVAVDVADAESMRELFARFGDDLPPLAGVVHAAAALGTATTGEMTPADVENMFRPKVAGTRLLHDLTTELDLDFFVMFSSTTALWGSRELGHYAAANLSLDAMAQHRRSLGLPALSISWGTWDEMRVASSEDRTEVTQGGMSLMPSEDALAALGDLLGRTDISQIAVAAVDWGVLKPLYESRRVRPFLADVDAPGHGRRSGRSAVESAPPALTAQLAETPAPARTGVVVEFLRDEVALALGVGDPRSIDADQGLFEMGMDSLMSVELKNRVETALGTNLPSTLTFNYPNITALAGYVVEDVLPELIDEPSDAATDDDPPGAPANTASVDTDDMSEDELAAMLATRLSRMK